THSLTFTARKSDLLNVSKSTASSNKGSTFTLEKSIFSGSEFGVETSLELTPFSDFTPPRVFIVGISNTLLVSISISLYISFLLGVFISLIT
ncbi:hypothetical protein, partial [Coprobacillus cateniformis]|uniref:hypothetical protein n=1 Tax=Coprobacillus cateniformis TaxID=100884 RepID=UPI0024A8EB3F